MCDQRVSAFKARELLKVFDCRKDERQLFAPVSVERALRGVPDEVNDLAAVNDWADVRRGGGEEEVGVEADLNDCRSDPARKLDELGRRDAADRCLFLKFAYSRQPVGLIALSFVGVHGAAGEYPETAHEASFRSALYEQQLERLRAATKQDYRGRLAWRRCLG